MKKYNYTSDGEYSKRGYLLNSFEVFSIKDKSSEKFEFHYHEFHKIIIFKSGDVKYNIEGKEYQLEANDILLVKSGDIHRPIINGNEIYDRIVIWIDDNYLNSINLKNCFNIAASKGLNIIKSADIKLLYSADELAKNKEDDFAFEQYRKAVLEQLLILITRTMLKNTIDTKKFISDKQIDDIIIYINNNLDKKLSVDSISDEFFISRYHLMHKFKKYTGKTIYSYIQSKRLLTAGSLIRNGMSVKTACYQSGFSDYSVFLKAFKKEFKITPTKYKDRELK